MFSNNHANLSINKSLKLHNLKLYTNNGKAISTNSLHPVLNSKYRNTNSLHPANTYKIVNGCINIVNLKPVKQRNWEEV